MKFEMTKPCDNCPFRTDGSGVDLTPGRWREIRTVLVAQQGTFACHKTVDYESAGDMEDGEDWHLHAQGPNTQHCAGALITLERANRPNQMMRISERLGLYDARKLDMAAEVAFGPHKAKAKVPEAPSGGR